MIPLNFSIHQPLPWAITPEGFANLHGRVMSGEIPSFHEKADSVEEYFERKADASLGLSVDKNSGVAVQPVKGVVYNGAEPLLEYLYGLFNLERVASAAERAVNDPSIKALVLAIDSPGGYSQGVAEAADLLVAAGREKPVLAYISGTGGSAAYWLAAATEEIHAAPFAVVGSIGTYSVTMDWSNYFLTNGVKVRVHRDGDLKGMGVMGKEWTKEELEYIQERVETTGKEFKDFIRARRPKIGEDEMRGQSFTARRTKAGEGRLVNGYEFRSLDRFLEAVAGEL